MPTNFPSWGHDWEGLESHFREKLQIPGFCGRVRAARRVRVCVNGEMTRERRMGKIILMVRRRIIL